MSNVHRFWLKILRNRTLDLDVVSINRTDCNLPKDPKIGPPASKDESLPENLAFFCAFLARGGGLTSPDSVCT
eukprot:481603-Prorocentrum_minimum.AAC.1